MWYYELDLLKVLDIALLYDTETYVLQTNVYNMVIFLHYLSVKYFSYKQSIWKISRFV